MHRSWRESAARCGGLDGVIGLSRIQNDRGVSNVGRYFLQNFELFAADRIFGIGKPGDVAARPREARNKPLCHRVGDPQQDDWYVCVSFCSSGKTTALLTKMTSGFIPTSSPA